MRIVWSRSFCVQGRLERGNLEISRCIWGSERGSERERSIRGGFWPVVWVEQTQSGYITFPLVLFSSVSSGPSATGRVTRVLVPPSRTGSCFMKATERLSFSPFLPAQVQLLPDHAMLISLRPYPLCANFSREIALLISHVIKNVWCTRYFGLDKMVYRGGFFGLRIEADGWHDED